MGITKWHLTQFLFLYSVCLFSLIKKCPLISANNFVGFWFGEFCVWGEKFTPRTILNVIWSNHLLTEVFLWCSCWSLILFYWVNPQETSHIVSIPQLFYWKQSEPLATIKMIFPMLKFSLLTPLAIAQKIYNSTVSAWIFGWGFWNFSSSKLQLWQLLEDFKSSVGVFLCAWCFAAATAATGIKVAAVKGQPGAVWTVREFETHHVAILQRVPIISVLGVDLEGSVGIAQPGVSCHGTGDSTNTTSVKLVYSQANISRNSLRDISIYCVIKRTKIKLIELVRKVQCQKKDPEM